MSLSVNQPLSRAVVATATRDVDRTLSPSYNVHTGTHSSTSQVESAIRSSLSPKDQQALASAKRATPRTDPSLNTRGSSSSQIKSPVRSSGSPDRLQAIAVDSARKATPRTNVSLKTGYSSKPSSSREVSPIHVNTAGQRSTRSLEATATKQVRQSSPAKELRSIDNSSYNQNAQTSKSSSGRASSPDRQRGRSSSPPRDSKRTDNATSKPTTSNSKQNAQTSKSNSGRTKSPDRQGGRSSSPPKDSKSSTLPKQNPQTSKSGSGRTNSPGQQRDRSSSPPRNSRRIDNSNSTTSNKQHSRSSSPAQKSNASPQRQDRGRSSTPSKDSRTTDNKSSLNKQSSGSTAQTSKSSNRSPDRQAQNDRGRSSTPSKDSSRADSNKTSISYKQTTTSQAQTSKFNSRSPDRQTHRGRSSTPPKDSRRTDINKSSSSSKQNSGSPAHTSKNNNRSGSPDRRHVTVKEPPTDRSRNSSPSRDNSKSTTSGNKSSKSPASGGGRGTTTQNSGRDASLSGYSDDDSDDNYLRYGTRPTGTRRSGVQWKRRSSGRQSRSKTRKRSAGGQSRQLSAGRTRFNELATQLNQLADRQATLKRENRELRWQQNVAQRRLEQYEVLESEIPTLVERQALDMHVLSEQLRLHDEKQSKKEKRLRAADDETERTERLVTKMRGIVQDKQLAERDELRRKLTRAEAALQQRERTVKSLESYADNLTRTHKHQMNAERAKFAESRQRLNDEQQKLGRIQLIVEERNKEMEVRNMYTARILKPPHRLDEPIIAVRHSPLHVSYATPLSPADARQPLAASPRTDSSNDSDGAKADKSKGSSERQHIEPEIIERTTYYDGPTFGSYRPTLVAVGPTPGAVGRRRAEPRYNSRTLRHAPPPPHVRSTRQPVIYPVGAASTR